MIVLVFAFSESDSKISPSEGDVDRERGTPILTLYFNATGKSARYGQPELIQLEWLRYACKAL